MRGSCLKKILQAAGGEIPEDSLKRVEATFREALARGQARGEIPATADLDSLARFLVASIQGLRLVGKANPDRAALNDIADVMLRCLDR